jgi:hypothetical protein
LPTTSPPGRHPSRHRTDASRGDRRGAASTSKSQGSDAIRNVGFQAGTFLGQEVEQGLLRHVVTDLLVPAMALAGDGESSMIDIPHAALPVELLRAGYPACIGYECPRDALRGCYARLLMIGGISDYLNEPGATSSPWPAPASQDPRLARAMPPRYATEGEERFYVPTQNSSQ